MKTSEAINEIATALAKAQGAIEGAVKGKENPHFRSKYADLGAVWDACRDHLTKNGIAVLQPLCHVEGRNVTVTRLVHSSGQWMEDDGIPLLLSKEDMQGLGSALTYSRRYGLMAMVGIAPEDDDGNAASSKAQAAAPPVPAGFEIFLATARQAAGRGTDELQKVWKAARPDHRRYMTEAHAAQWDELKAKAVEVGKEPVHA